MALVWFYQSSEGEKNGPFGNRQLKNLAIEGKITPDTLVWKNGMKKWKLASAVVGLFGEKSLNTSNETPPKMPTSIAGIPEWYYLLNGKRNGPVMIGVLKEVINSNRDLAPTLVWKMGMKEWTPFENIYPDLSPLPMQTPIQSSNSFNSNQLGGVPLGLGDFLTTVSPQNIGWFSKITHPTPLWVAYIVNCLAWLIFVSNRNHILEACMGLACVYVGFVAISKKEEKYAVWLINVSFADALWMFYWAFSKPFDFSID